jgi:thioredoxin reductase
MLDSIIIGAGPAGLAAAITLKEKGKDVLVIEREAKLGGILKQCIHDGFGLITFNEKLTGPEYAHRFVEKFKKLDITALTLSFVTDIKKIDEVFFVTVVNSSGITIYQSKTLILATGCRERTAKQVSIQGTRPSGVFTAGQAQLYTNIYGKKVSKKAVILGSGDIGLIMARRLTLEGTQVVGVYEVKPTPSGLTRNIHQCLKDYNIPLYLSQTVTRIEGRDRLEGVYVSKVDEHFQKIGEETFVPCDALILSVGLIPEIELSKKLEAQISANTHGMVVDQRQMSTVSGFFTCGNAMHVNDLVDYVTMSAVDAANYAAEYVSNQERNLIDIQTENLGYLVPEKLDLNKDLHTKIYFRSKETCTNATLKLFIDGDEVFKKKYPHLLPPEMVNLDLDFGKYKINKDSKVKFVVGDK